MARGGKRNGAGRPKGSTSKPKLSDYITEEEVQEIIIAAKDKAKGGDTRMLTFILEQIFGKAPQSIEANHTGVLTITFDSAFNKDA